MSRTINKVTRDLIERSIASITSRQVDAEAVAELRALLSAPSHTTCGFAGCKSLGMHHPFCDYVSALDSEPSPARASEPEVDRNAAFKACPESGCDWGSYFLGWKARGEVDQGIIDALKSDNKALTHESELGLQRYCELMNQLNQQPDISKVANTFDAYIDAIRGHEIDRKKALEFLVDALDQYFYADQYPTPEQEKDEMRAATTALQETVPVNIDSPDKSLPELLELAAKAAGIEVRVSFNGAGWWNNGNKIWPQWNPRTKDGDSFRLAMSIPGLNISSIIAEAWLAHKDLDSRMDYIRLGVVRAAAAAAPATEVSQ